MALEPAIPGVAPRKASGRNWTWLPSGGLRNPRRKSLTCWTNS